MIDVNIKYELYDYILFENENQVGVYQLTSFEAKQKNYAFRLNRVNKVYKLLSKVKDASGSVEPILIVPTES
tara:strand:- start:19 stop:234 length:216 start_codon:yes stop_codon:yes gene_type:complete